ncbi:Hypothetical predicted protein [Octopus vulgaris]|uniref:Uncharacterized protein n=1 Tax=Octopus vulgaris TaxID=6645 RepID=A0AA36BJG9_OCTVU|nr:Hypothetical predicted protein [Octopus vulgaris]
MDVIFKEQQLEKGKEKNCPLIKTSFSVDVIKELEIEMSHNVGQDIHGLYLALQESPRPMHQLKPTLTGLTDKWASIIVKGNICINVLAELDLLNIDVG